jgi:hypothetical protein
MLDVLRLGFLRDVLCSDNRLLTTEYTHVNL